MIHLAMNGDSLLPGPKVGGGVERMMSPLPAASYRSPLNGIKRGSDELLSQSGGVSNGSVLSPPPNITDNNNDAKKVKLDKNQNVNPSKVIHIRNIPNEISEAEIIHLGIPFGRVTNVLVLKGKNQAFLEMADESAASQMVNYFTTCVANLRGRSVYVQYSNHKELKTDLTHSNANASAQAALQAAQALTGSSAGGTTSETQGGPNTVLRVIVDHMIYPVTLDVLHQIFSKYGRVQKIVTFTKNNTFQALIQYPDVVTSQAAKLSLDGQNVYNQCCTLRIEYSKLTTLNVKYNNDKSRDYTNPNLPSGDPGLDGLSAADLLPQLLIANSSPPRHTQARLQAAGVVSAPFAGLHSLSSPLAFGAAGLPLAPFQLPQANAALSLRLPGAGCVLLVTNLNQEMVTPDALFTLFGVYGDVQRVKILYNKKDSALVQMAEPLQAHIAMTHLDKLRVFGKNMNVMPSKHQVVQLPRDGQPDAGLTKDYINSSLHRFKKPGSKNYQNIYPPSATLHLSNIPPTVSEEEIREAFAKHNYQVKGFKFFPKDRKMALLELLTVDDAVMALIKMHNFQLSESNHLRVSFSKSSI